MSELKKQHLEMLQLLESIEVMLQNGDSIHPDSVIRGAIQTAIGMDINLNNKKMEKEKSVVEFLINQLGIKKDGWNNDVLKKAKSIEKKQREKDFVEGYKTRALASNLIFDEKSEYYAKSLFNRIFKLEI